MSSEEIVGLIILVAAIFLVFLLANRKTAPRARRSGTEKVPGSSRNVPRERGALTRHLQTHYSDIEGVKRRVTNRQRVPAEMDRWLAALGRAICDVGIHTQTLGVREKFAAIFVVNKLFHDGCDGAEEKKNFFQRTIILYHRSEVTLKFVRSGKYADTYEISCGVWSTHVPKFVVDEGGLERPGKPSATKALRPPSRRW